jgi:hypothetical protein
MLVVKYWYLCVLHSSRIEMKSFCDLGIVLTDNYRQLVRGVLNYGDFFHRLVLSLKRRESHVVNQILNVV